MDGTREAGPFLGEIKPPRIEDAGLEDCALPPESIREAFLKAAAAARSVISDSDDDEDESDADDRPEDKSDDLLGSKEEVAACATENGGRLAEITGGEVSVGDGLEGLEIGGKKAGGEEKGKKPN
ncbi:hypothetical protein CASFOL_024880 [Castilleja foliolosa]|uniref:Uncharacterized protein n=1 Tax=Castilleja foliolosa TaxID=1961234 RepID=A0ABD3CPL4_9LAMI